MNTSASTTGKSTRSSYSNIDIEQSQTSSIWSLEAGFVRLVRQARKATGLTNAGLFWVSYLSLIGLIAIAALA